MNERGMTLLEVMVALMVLAIAGLAAMKTSTEQVRNLDYLEQKQIAAWVAENQMTWLRLQNVWPAERWHQGQTEMADQTWYWRWQGVSTTTPKLRALEIEVHQDANYSQPLALLRTYRVTP
ncbi:Tfp pilus assembly protein PilV [Serratia quinivorans]|uniref:type II secretion system minor pseudopilin GspI n=1 Tax=Serratia quinivorans TaxID=137545 RepID=UPI00217C6E6C|nr:type II secretion system minor pseudopilin GspI [Serratia quinivorans]CAI1926529.1 Tfp pilus assembly protein PilV [Serratia quinivorans]